MSADFKFWPAMSHVCREQGKGRLAQCLDLARLALPPQRLSPLEYYSFRLYDDALYPWPEKRRFLGRMSKYYRRLRHRDWYGVAEDKLLFYAAMLGHGEPVPALYALFSRQGRRFGGVPSFSEPDALAAFLRQGMRYPFFGKPVQGVYGQGAVYATGYDAASDSLELRQGGLLPVGEFVQGLLDPRGMGYLMQEPLRSHPDFQALFGEHLPGVRLDIFWGEGAPKPVYARLHVAVGKNIINNLQGGRLGNLYGVIDMASGRMEPVLTQFTWHSITRQDIHPDTGAQVHGELFPRWRELVDYGLHLAPLFPGLRLQSWDLVMTDQGPRALELNLGGDSLFMAQRMTRRPFLSDEVRAYAEKLPIT
ncbi:MAG: hypothetical protein HYV16_10525 [Gammaproteobacteria bacterium]|nr:hypothetical protein [Gammaproteobacteria bacterium]